MEIGNCKDCKYFKRQSILIEYEFLDILEPEYKNYGYCQKVNVKNNYNVNVTGRYIKSTNSIVHIESFDSIDLVLVGEDFGCVHFMKKDGK